MDNIDDLTLDTAAADACELLYKLSGRKFPGVCERKIRPAARPWTMPVADWQYLLNAISYSGYVGLPLGLCRGWNHAECDQGYQIDLGVYPIVSIVSVLIGGVAVDPAAYRVDNSRLLVRTDGLNWPTCQNLHLDDDQPGTFAVIAKYGAVPGSAGLSAATTLAAEMAKFRSGGKTQLPQRVVSVTRQGVAMTASDPLTFIQEGFTGIAEVDQWVQSENPFKQKLPPLVYSPDTGSATFPGR